MNINTQDFLSVIIRSGVSAFVLFLLARLMGKKQIAQLTFFDYAVGISIGSIAGDTSLNQNITVYHGILSMIVWAVFPIAFSFISLKTNSVRKILDGNPIILIQDGNIIEKNLLKSKLTVNDLLEELRQKEIFNIAEVEFAVFETNGKMSVMRKPQFNAVTVSDMNIFPKYKGLCTNLIIDGKVISKSLEISGKNKIWLNEQLIKNNTEINNVLLASLDTNDILTIQLKDNSIKANNVID